MAGTPAQAMEVAGLAVGIVGLAGLFGACTQTLEQANDFRNFEYDSQILLSLFEIEKLALKRWGESVGFVNGEVKEPYHRSLNDIQCQRTVYNTLVSIQDIVTNTQTTAQKYERPLSYAESSQPRSLVDVQSGITDHTGTIRRTSWRTKAVWAAKDKRKLTKPVELLGALIEKLYKVVPPEERRGNVMSDPTYGLDRLKSFLSGNCSIPQTYLTNTDRK